MSTPEISRFALNYARWGDHHARLRVRRTRHSDRMYAGGRSGGSLAKQVIIEAGGKRRGRYGKVPILKSRVTNCELACRLADRSRQRSAVGFAGRAGVGSLVRQNLLMPCGGRNGAACGRRQSRRLRTAGGFAVCVCRIFN